MRSKRGAALALWALVMTAAPGRGSAQVTEDRDVLGLAIPYRLVHLQHTTDPSLAGGTADLRAHRPFLLYQLGRDLVIRQFQIRHGAFGRPGALDVPLYVGATIARSSRDHAASCGTCHTTPYREPGSGLTIASTSSAGRNTPHFYGGGLVEMLGEGLRDELMARCDRDGNGVLDRREVASVACRLRVQATSDGPWVDYGTPAPGPDGVPRLNGVFRVWYLDRDGRVLADACGFGDRRVEAIGVAMQPFGWGRGRRPCGGGSVAQGGEAATLREFFATAADAHLGLQAFDPSQQAPPHAGLRAGISLAGAQQYDFGGSTDTGRTTNAARFSLDDPDGDRVVSELTEGDLDAAELYMLHAPAPATVASADGERGRAVLEATGCTRCHVERWDLPRARDRRLFHLDASGRRDEAGDDHIAARLVRTSVAERGELRPAGGPVPIDFVYSDFKHWDLGPGFHERRFDGSVQREHRTAPLWGVASTPPYGHDGKYPTLDAVIRAHAGAAAAEQARYRALSAEQRRQLLAWLASLVLYPTDLVPADLDGDGAIDPAYRVGGIDVGYERFDARFLFETAPRFARLATVTSPEGRPWPLLVLLDVEDAFGLTLPFRADRDGDGFPDRPIPKDAR